MAKSYGLVPKFKSADIKKFLSEATQRLDQAIIMRFSFIGETFVANARTNHTYKDVTGNLTASIGYIVLKNGRKVSGSPLPKALKGKYSKGYVLVVYAGMDYAAAVESRGKDVITGSSLMAKVEILDALEKFKSLISSKTNG